MGRESRQRGESDAGVLRPLKIMKQKESPCVVGHDHVTVDFMFASSCNVVCNSTSTSASICIPRSAAGIYIFSVLLLTTSYPTTI